MAPPLPAPVPRLSLPSNWFVDPFWAKIRKLVRPATGLTRRKELTIELSMPRDIFEDIMAPVKEGEVTDLKRDPHTKVPTYQPPHPHKLDGLDGDAEQVQLHV